MMQKPLVNWDEILRLTRPMLFPEGNAAPPSAYGAWDKNAAFYDQMAKMEAKHTLNQINCFDTASTDTVLDCGCGPGRISVPMAKRAKSVTSLDSSPKMLEFCAQNAKEAGLINLTTQLLSFEDIELGKNLEQHDIVICSRSFGLSDLLKLTTLAKKYVVTVIWSHGCPSIPEISGYLFEGTEDELSERPPFMGMRQDRRLGNNMIYNRVYDLGFEPNLNVVEDGFTKTFACRDEAYADLRRLRSNMKDDKLPIFRANVDKFLTENADGTVTYFCGTKSVVVWWKPERAE